MSDKFVGEYTLGLSKGSTVFAMNLIWSIAIVGTSAIIARRNALATDMSWFTRMKETLSLSCFTILTVSSSFILFPVNLRRVDLNEELYVY